MAFAVIVPRRTAAVPKLPAIALIARNSTQNATSDGALCEVVLGCGAKGRTTDNTSQLFIADFTLEPTNTSKTEARR